MFPPAAHRGAETGVSVDDSIRLTDSDAALARLSATQKQYFHDPFIKHFIPRAHLQPPRPPLINVGTYVRSEAIDELAYRWIHIANKDGTRCQIVSLGAGSDTRFWRLAVRFLDLSI
jgi:[phosphatase 2A protein]-leucine-carboxy methyltransferase